MAIKDDLITSAFFNCTSMAHLYLELDSPMENDQSVFFYVKTESLTEWAESFVAVTVGFSKENEFLGRVEWLNPMLLKIACYEFSSLEVSS